MSKAAGFILKLQHGRRDVFDDSYAEDSSFAEPVIEFTHSRNKPLICFVVNEQEQMTHLAIATRGRQAGTGLRRLNLYQILKLKNEIHFNQINFNSPSRVKRKLEEKLNHGGLVPPKSLEALVDILSRLAPEARTILSAYNSDRIEKIRSLTSEIRATLAQQKEAVATALTISGIDRKELRGWDYNDEDKISSFLDGLEKVRVREDTMIIHDLMNIPGYNVIKNVPHNSVVFEGEKSKLTVVLANRLPLEKQLGTDLIYYNETYSCFTMVQYKAMEEEAGELGLRFPNPQLSEEINRMSSVLSELRKCPPNSEADGFRLCETPFFLKVCPRIIFEPDNVGLVKGMYLPLEYWEMLSHQPDMLGPRGGKRLTYKNVRRYFDNTSFISLVSGGWVGTTIEQSNVLCKVITSTLESGRAVVFAVSSD